MINACKGASRSPVGAGITSTKVSKTPSTPKPVFAEHVGALVASIPIISSIS